MNLPLKFCVACGRAVSASDLQKVGLKIQKGTDANKRPDGRSFDLSRKNYMFQRQMRTFFWSFSAILAIFIAYYGAMRFVLKEHLPFNADIYLEHFLTGRPIPLEVSTAPKTEVPPDEAQTQPTKPPEKKTEKKRSRSSHHRAVHANHTPSH